MAIQDLKTSLDLKQDLNIYLKCKQFDNLNLILSIFDNSLQADLTNYDVRLRAMKADNVPLIQEHIGIDIDGNIVNIQADAQLTTTAGNTPIELQFIDKSTGEKKATFNLVLVVVASAIAIEASISKATYTLLEELENKIDQASDFLEHIGEAIEANTNLINSINIANETKEALDDSNTTALATKEALDESNTNATNTKNELDTLNTTSNNTKENLNVVNQTGQTLLNSLENFEEQHADVADISNQLANVNTQLSDIAINIKTFGAKGDGVSHTISSIFPSVTLAEVQTYDSTATLESEADWYAFVKCVEYCIANDRNMFIPDGAYIISNMIKISNPIKINCSINATFNVKSQLLSVASKNVIFDGKPTINITQNFSGNLIEFLTPTYGGDTTIIDCEFDINVVGGQYTNNSSNYPYDISVIKFNGSGIWRNKFNFNIKDCNTGYDFNNSWINGNEFRGTIINAINAVNIHGTASLHANSFKLDIEQLLNITTYGVKSGDNLLTSYARSNSFDINFWLDNYSGKFYAFYVDIHFTSNKIYGNIEGLLYGIDPSNVFEVLYFTKRDRSVIPNDRTGTYNSGLITTHNHKNLIRNGSFNNDIYGFNSTDVTKVLATFETSEYFSGGSCLKYSRIASNSAYIMYNIDNYQYLKGKRVTLTLRVKAPISNIRDDYGVFLNDGISNNSIKIPKTGEWEKLTLSYTLSQSATILQINFGRMDSTIATDGTGDVLYFDEICLIEGSYLDQPYIPHTVEPTIITPTLLNGWVKNTRTPYIYKNDKLIHVSMRISSGTNISDTIICNTGYGILGGTQNFPIYGWDSGLIGYVYVTTIGTIQIFSPLSAINDVNINFSYISQ